MGITTENSACQAFTVEEENYKKNETKVLDDRVIAGATKRDKFTAITEHCPLTKMRYSQGALQPIFLQCEGQFIKEGYHTPV